MTHTLSTKPPITGCGMRRPSTSTAGPSVALKTCRAHPTTFWSRRYDDRQQRAVLAHGPHGLLRLALDGDLLDPPRRGLAVVEDGGREVVGEQRHVGGDVRDREHAVRVGHELAHLAAASA